MTVQRDLSSEVTLEGGLVSHLSTQAEDAGSRNTGGAARGGTEAHRAGQREGESRDTERGSGEGQLVHGAGHQGGTRRDARLQQGQDGRGHMREKNTRYIITTKSGRNKHAVIKTKYKIYE